MGAQRLLWAFALAAGLIKSGGGVPGAGNETGAKIINCDANCTNGKITGAKGSPASEQFFHYYASNNPVLMLVDGTERAYEAARAFLANPKSNAVEFYLMKFNSTGATKILASNRNVGLMAALLNWDEANAMQTSTLAFESENETAAFFAILNAARRLAPNCAILLFVGRGALDEDVAQLALQELRRKNIRMFVVWTGIDGRSRGEERVLRETAAYSNGVFLIDKGGDFSYANLIRYLRSEDAKVPKSVVVSRRKLRGKQAIEFPIDSGVSNLHASFSAGLTSALLSTPSGHTIDLLNDGEVEGFSSGSFASQGERRGTREIQLNFSATKPTPTVGVWRLKTDDFNGDLRGYDVVISVQTKLNAHAPAVALNKGEKTLTFDLSGDVAEVTGVNFVDEQGAALEKAVRFTSGKIKKEDITDDVETIEANGDALEVVADDPPRGPFYVQINGRDGDGNNFTRLSYVNANTNADRRLQALTVEVGLGSQLLVKQNEFAQIYFEVTNNRDYTTSLRFRCRDEKSWLVRMQPLFAWLNPRQTVIVTLTIRPGIANNAGYRDTLTFTAAGADIVKKTVIVKASDKEIDLDEPRLYHRYTSDCMNVLLGSCEDGTWTIEASAQDDTGLLQFSSNPPALYFPNGYTAGTTELITGYYTGSCCQPKLQLTAVDLKNNRRTYTANAYVSQLSPGSIAAIVLGVVLLILLIIGIVLLCRWKCKDRESIELSTYRAPSRRY